jgi:uncharacterized protein YjbI with pentapeptide repeats
VIAGSIRISFNAMLRRADATFVTWFSLSNTQESRFKRRASRSTPTFRTSEVTGSNCKARFEQGLTVVDASVKAIDLTDTLVVGPVKVTLEILSGAITLQGGRFDGPFAVDLKQGKAEIVGQALFQGLMVEAPRIANLNLSGAVVRGDCVLRGPIEQSAVAHRDAVFRFAGTRFEGDVDWRGCIWRGSVDLSGASFASTLDCRGCFFFAELLIDELEHPPTEVRLDGATINNRAVLAARFGEAPLRVTARKAPVLFSRETDRKTILKNVNLAECRLVGNHFDLLRLSAVEWHKPRGRAELYDEDCLRKKMGVSVCIPRLLESVQFLKERYKTAGDHARSGDFHFSEMELKRRTYGAFRRWLGLEALYGYLSGYGTNPRLSFLWLSLVTLVAAYGYWSLAPDAGFWPALVYSIEVLTFQRSNPPADGIARAIRVAETVLGTVLIALSVLAVRMRLKR